MTEQEAQALVRKAQAGDLAAFEAIVYGYEKQLYHVALGLLRNREDAEDAVQETFLKVYTALNTWRGEGKFSAWLFRILRNICIDMLRRRKDSVSLSMEDEEGAEELEVPDGRYDPAELAERRDLTERVNSALESLPEKFRTPLLLRAFGERSYDEIGAILSLDEGTVKSRIFRARKKLCALLDGTGNISARNASEKKKGGVQV